MGKRMMKLVMLPGTLSTRMVPPWCSVTMKYDTERPSPVPAP